MKRRLVMAGVATAAILCQGGLAWADSGEDVLSGFDSDSPLVSNVSVLPVQTCGTGVAVGALADLSDNLKTGNCTNAPTGDPLQQLITNSTIN